MKTQYVHQLPSEIFETLKKEIQVSLFCLGLRGTELENDVESALNSRLCDLEEVVNVDKYL